MSDNAKPFWAEFTAWQENCDLDDMTDLYAAFVAGTKISNSALEKRLNGLERAICLTTNPTGPEFLDWVADRFVYLYNENPNTDFVQALHRMAIAIRAIVAADAPGKSGQ